LNFLFRLNALPPDALSGDGGISLGESSSRKYKLALLVTFVLAFCGLIGALAFVQLIL
jgi:Trk-type K+ transport system membrane component